MGARIEIIRDTARPTLRRAMAAMQGDGLRLMLDDIGRYMRNATMDRAEREVAPDGSPWPALTPRDQRRKQRKRPGRKMLRFDNHMLGDRLAHQVVGDAVLVGTSAIYGATHQFGRGNIQARVWLGLSDEDETEIEAIAADHLSGMFEE